ncbi:MAG: hypothetical protein ACE5NC_07040 [Anaerolineae bacterium]
MRLRILALIATLALSLLAAPLTAEAQKTGKVYRIGWLGVASPSVASPFVKVFLEALRDLGWVERENFLMEYRWAEGKLEHLPGLAGELARLKVDVIVTAFPAATSAARQGTATIPIVMM